MSKEADLFESVSVWQVAAVAAMLAGTWILLRWLKHAFDRISDKHPRMRFLVRGLEPALRIALWFIVLLLAANILAPNREAFVATLGSAAIAIGLGAQDLIKNLIGGLIVVTDRPYQLGDRLRMGNAYGEVQHIGLRSTKIMTPDDTLVTVPNAEVLGSQTFNSNAGVPECMVTADLFLPPNSDPDLVLRIAREVAISCPFTHLGRRIAIKLEDCYTESPFMNLKIRAYVYDHRKEPEMQTDLVRRCKKEFIARGMLEY